MSNQEAEAFIKKLDEGLAIAEQEMLRDKASRGESVVHSYVAGTEQQSV